MRRNGPAVYYPGGAQKWSQHVAAVVIACRMVGVVVVE
jgi:hypothetical protein